MAVKEQSSGEIGRNPLSLYSAKIAYERPLIWNNDSGYLYAGRINANNERRIIMWKDPIVQEVRKAGEELAEQANYSLRDLFNRLRDNEKKSKAKVVAGIKKKNLQKAG